MSRGNPTSQKGPPPRASSRARRKVDSKLCLMAIVTGDTVDHRARCGLVGDRHDFDAVTSARAPYLLGDERHAKRCAIEDFGSEPLGHSLIRSDRPNPHRYMRRASRACACHPKFGFECNHGRERHDCGDDRGPAQPPRRHGIENLLDRMFPLLAGDDVDVAPIAKFRCHRCAELVLTTPVPLASSSRAS